VKILTALLAALTVGCSPLDKPLVRPKAILLIRHAEKPAGDDVHLSPEGKKRAETLPDLFQKSADRPDPFPTPDFIFATKPSKHSNRPVETVAPLAKALKLEVNAGYANDDYPALAEELFTNPKYEGKTVLVSWHHGTLPGFAIALGATDVPDKWKDSVFDRVWVVTFDQKGKAKPLTKRPQVLMPGDGKE
jgi:broad specificity phosphatase PhoE